MAAAALIPAQLFVLGPLGVLSDNRAEFVGTTWNALVPCLVGGLLLFGLLVGFSAVLGRHRERLAAALAAAGGLMWVASGQTGRFNLLDGSIPDWDAVAFRSSIEIGVWALVLAVATLWGPALRRAVLPTVLCLTLAQAVPLLMAAREAPAEAPAEQDGAFAQLARLSSGGPNVFLLILDAVGRDHVTEILQEDPALRARFPGFRLFTDHLATFPTTRFSIPVMVSGRVYDNRMPAAAFTAEAYTGADAVVLPFAAAGFDTGIASTVRDALRLPADHRLGVERSSAVTARRGLTPGLELIDLSLFRHAPIVGKRWLFDSGSWRLRRLSNEPRRSFHAIRSLHFMRAFTAALRADSPRPSFRIVHVGGAHTPVVVDRQCRFIGVQQPTARAYSEQVRCSLGLVVELLQRMESLGILDSTFLAVAADHGVPIPSQAASGNPESALDGPMQRSAALLMIKPFDARRPLAFDDSPTSAVDLSKILVRAADGWDEADESMLAQLARAGRERPFRHHEWKNGDWRKHHLTSLFEFAVSSPSQNPESWRLVATVPAPDISAESLEQQHRTARALRAATEPPG